MDSGKESGPEEQYARLIEKATDGIAILVNGRIVLLNSAMGTMLEYDPQELIGEPFDKLVDPSSSARFVDSLHLALKDQADDSGCRASLKTRSGRKVEVVIEMNTMVYQDNPAIALFAENVSETIKMQRAVRLSDERYSRLYQRSPIACFTVTSQGIIQEANPAAEQLLGYDVSEMLKRSISSFLSDEEAKRGFDRQIISEVLQGKNPAGIELQMKHKDGGGVWVSLTASEIGADVESRIAFMVTDIERRKTAELREQTERERASLVLEIMTHDMNNVNQSLLFALGLIETSVELSPELETVIAETSWNVRRAARMIANLKAIIRIMDHDIPTARSDLFSQIQEATKTVEADLPWKTLNVETEICAGDIEVVGNEYLESAFFNIIHNSAMFDSSEEVLVEISVDDQSTSDMVRIEVSDHGPGIPDALKELIFKRTGRPEGQKVGRGLGLTLVDSIINGLGGRIWVEDRVPGDHTRGAKFVVLLPRWREEIVLECGKVGCIQFYVSSHCVFCDPALEILYGVIDEMGASKSLVEVIDVDDPTSGVKEGDLPKLPCIRICDMELTGFINHDEVRKSILTMLLRPCYPK